MYRCGSRVPSGAEGTHRSGSNCRSSNAIRRGCTENSSWSEFWQKGTATGEEIGSNCSAQALAKLSILVARAGSMICRNGPRHDHFMLWAITSGPRCEYINPSAHCSIRKTVDQQMSDSASNVSDFMSENALFSRHPAWHGFSEPLTAYAFGSERRKGLLIPAASTPGPLAIRRRWLFLFVLPRARDKMAVSCRVRILACYSNSEGSAELRDMRASCFSTFVSYSLRSLAASFR